MKTIKDIILELGKPMPYKWRVQSYSKNKPLAICVAYIDARDVMRRLDEVCDEGWSDRYYESAGLLMSEITIYCNGNEYKRCDTGTESKAEAQKGHASDAFKRAAVKFNIGRFLYDLDMKYIPANERYTGNNYPYPVDKSGKRIWDITEHINSENVKQITIYDATEVAVNLSGIHDLRSLNEYYQQFDHVNQKAHQHLFTERKKELSLNKKAA